MAAKASAHAWGLVIRPVSVAELTRGWGRVSDPGQSLWAAHKTKAPGFAGDTC